MESNLVIQIIKKDNEIMELHDIHLKSIASCKTCKNVFFYFTLKALLSSRKPKFRILDI